MHGAHSRFRAAATLRIVSGLGFAQPDAPGFHLGTGNDGPCAPGARNGKVSRAAACFALRAAVASAWGLALVMAIVLLHSSRRAGSSRAGAW